MNIHRWVKLETALPPDLERQPISSQVLFQVNKYKEIVKMLKRFTAHDLIIIAILAAMGIAIKPLVNPSIKLISAPLMLPGGSLAGGLYMMWLALAVAMVPKTGSATLFGIVQALATFVLGWFGNHGALSLLSYTLPGIIADGISLLPLKRDGLTMMILVCSMANLCGSLIMSLVIFRMPLLPLAIASATALGSGVLGGIIAWLIYRQIKDLGLLQ